MSMLVYTRYVGPTDTKGARISARASHLKHRNLTIPFDYALSSFTRHEKAARALMLRNGLKWSIVASADSADSGYAFIFAQECEHCAPIHCDHCGGR